MNFKSISFYLSLFCFPVSILAFINILYASYFNYFLSIETYFITLGVSLIIGAGFYFFGKKSDKKINFIDQLILIILVYIIVGLLISTPFYLSNFKVSFLSAFFESISGLTGTGFSTFENVRYLDPTLILWRSSSQWIGGLYFLFFLVLIFSNKSFNYKMTNLTYSGENIIQSNQNIKDNILKIFIYYSILSFIFLVLLNISGIRLFNSLNLTMTLVSGGGFLPTNSLNNIITTNLQKLILIFLLTLSMLNFYFLFNLFNKKNFKIFFTLILIFIVWFLYFPTLRYAGYIIVFVMIIFPIITYFDNKIDLTSKKNLKKLFFLILISYTIFLYKNVTRINQELKIPIENHHNFENFPFFWIKDNDVKKVFVDGQTLYKVNGSCWNTKSTCIRSTENLKVYERKGYLFYKNE